MSNSTLTNPEYKPRGLTTENNNVSKTIRHKIDAIFYDIKGAVTCDCVL